MRRLLVVGALVSGCADASVATRPPAPPARAPVVVQEALPVTAGNAAPTPAVVEAGGVDLEATYPYEHYPPEVIQKVVRANFGLFRRCYENNLQNSPNLQGRVTVEFAIETDGEVSVAMGEGDLPDRAVIDCVAARFETLRFPKTTQRIVVTYPVVFSPGS